MLKKVRIKRVPQARTGYQVRGSLFNDVPAMGGADYNAYIGEKPMEMSKYMTAVPREEANLEAEGGETVYGDINGDGMPEHKTIKGPRHSAGGVPLKLPDDTFIFSDTKSMKVKEPQFLAMFGKVNGSYTPADLAKQYDIERYRKILQDPNSDKLDRKTAELMLKNYTLKLGALALAQESKKGFPQGIPAVAKPYMEAMGIKEEDVLPEKQIADTVKQLDEQQSNAQRSAETMASPTEQQVDEYGDQAEEAQMINSDRPVAQPMSEEDMAAGMTPEETQMQYGGMSQYAHGGWMPEEVAVFTGQMPYAEYGMAMGANSQNYEGREKNMYGSGPMFYEKGGYLPKAQDGITVDTTGMTPEQREQAFYNARTKNPGKKITELKDGKKYEVNYSRSVGTDVEGVDMKLFGNTPQSVAAAAQYKILENSLNDEEVMAKLCEETTSSLKDPRSYKQKDRPGKPGSQGQTWEQRGLNMPDCNQVKQAFLQHQKRNLAFQGNQVDPKLFTDSGQGLASLDEIVSRKAINPQTGKPITDRAQAEEARKYLSKTYGAPGASDVSINAISQKIGIPLEASTSDRALQQATFHGYSHMVDNMSKYDPNLQYKARNFVGNMQAGTGDENSMQGLFSTQGVQISPIDDFTEADKSYYGNTTAGHLAAAGIDKYDVKSVEENEDKKIETVTKKKCPCEKSDGTVIEVGTDPNTGECNPCEEKKDLKINKPAEWWLQDTIKSAGAYGDLMGIKKYMPWQSRLALETPRPTFLDPTRELAANAEQAKIQTQGIAQFAGPQAQSARASSVQGTSSKNAADILSRYNNANVNVANQFEMNATNIRNQGQMANQAAAQSWYDKNTIANQQFDNSKLALRNNARNQYTNAITNRAKTDAMNQLYPQYAVSPGSGGFMNFTQGKTVNGAGASSGKTYDEWLSYYKNDQKMSESAAVDAAKNAYNAQNNTAASTDKAQVIKNAYGRLGGQMKKGGFVYGDVTFPFLM